MLEFQGFLQRSLRECDLAQGAQAQRRISLIVLLSARHSVLATRCPDPCLRITAQ